jgi:CMP-N-acetylneuraminic acid synthetase
LLINYNSYLYLFDWKLLSEEGQTFSEPKNTINLNNMQGYELKKDLRIEITEMKKGLFSSTKKTLLRAQSAQDLEEWTVLLDKLLP